MIAGTSLRDRLLARKVVNEFQTRRAIAVRDCSHRTQPYMITAESGGWRRGGHTFAPDMLDDLMKSNPVVAGRLVTSRPTSWWNACQVFCYGGFFCSWQCGTFVVVTGDSRGER